MKTFFLSFLIFSSFSAQCQSLKGVFTINRLKSTGDNTILSEKAKKPEVFSYIYSDKKSIETLISKQKSSVDTIYIEKYGDKIATTSTLIVPSAITYYKDFNSKIYKHLSTTDGVDINIKTKLPTHNWKLFQETKIINGFTCKKATTKNTEFSSNQNITAWYTEDIPIGDGPMFYNGLPGFIIQIEIDDQSILVFQKLAYSDENILIEIPNNTAKEMSFEEYLAQQ